MSVKKVSVLKPLSASIVVGLVVSMSGCSNIGSVIKLPDKKIDYKGSKTVKSLDVPPDLSSPDYDETYARLPSGGVSASAYAQQRRLGGGEAAVLPSVQGVNIVNQGGVRYLQVAAAPEVLWSRLTGFWSTMGVSLQKDEPRIGVMETEWAENRAGLPMDWLRKAVGSVFQGVYDAGVRDKFRLRVERAGAGTNVYVSHQRAEEVLLDNGGVKWALRPSDPELEAIILNRIVAHLGGASKEAQVREAASVSNVSMSTVGGRPALKVGGRFSDVWLRTGVVLERQGLSVEKQRKDDGVYEVVYRDKGSNKSKEGWLSRIFKSNNEVVRAGGVYQIHITDSGSYSLVSVTDKEGEPVSPSVAQILLEQLKMGYER